MTLDEAIDAAIKADIPKYKLIYKRDSSFMKLLDKFVKIFNGEFMTRYTTTIYPNIYAPEKRARSVTFWKTKAHEWVHLVKAKKYTSFINSCFYMFPQSLAPLALVSVGAIWGSMWFLLNFGWLLCLAPIPAYFRMKEEMEAYAMSMACNYWRYGSIQQSQMEWLEDHFTSGDYYFMWPFKKNVEKRLETLAAEVISGSFDKKHPFDKVKAIIEANNDSPVVFKL